MGSLGSSSSVSRSAQRKVLSLRGLFEEHFSQRSEAGVSIAILGRVNEHG